MKEYRVVIPYYHEFIVNAENKKDAVEKAHSSEGNITGWDDENIYVEEA